MSETTLDLAGISSGDGALTLRPMLALAYCAHEPHRIGEVIDPPARGEVVLGRGGTVSPPAELLRIRPGSRTVEAPLNDPWLSRRQLVFGRRGERITFRNEGRCPARHGLRVAAEGELAPGDTLTLEQRAVFVCVVRPTALPTMDIGVDHEFGEADEYGIVGESPAAWLLRHQLRMVARREHHVLLLGESGTGKELAARTVHACSSRGRSRLVSRNAATFPEGLIDAELFGNARNYPNPGMTERSGLFGDADGSSLFLDELGELPDALQAHLLRALDDGEYQRLGESRTRRADVRLIGATNRSPQDLRHDLLARFALQVGLPPLRERVEDVPLLFRHLLRQIGTEHADLRARFYDDAPAGSEPRVALGLVRALLGFPHPLNVRGLLRIAWQSLLGSPGDRLVLTDALSASLEQAGAEQATDVETVTAEQIQAALDAHDGVMSAAWKALGLRNRYVLRRLVQKYEKEGWTFRKG